MLMGNRHSAAIDSNAKILNCEEKGINLASENNPYAAIDPTANRKAAKPKFSNFSFSSHISVSLTACVRGGEILAVP